VGGIAAYPMPTTRPQSWVSSFVQGSNVFINNTGCSKGTVDIRKLSNGEVFNASVLITVSSITVTVNNQMLGPYNIIFMGIL
jgi:hypothetical protein